MFAKNGKYVIGLFGLALGIVFCLVVYPRIYVSQHAVLDSDGWDALGRGIWKNSTLSYFPDTEPTVDRGPAYPLFLAAILRITNGRWWPYSIQLAQCVLFGLTCLVVFWIAEVLWNKRIAILSSSICATYPFLIWYTSRIWVETLATFLFVVLVASTVYLNQRPTILRSILVGLALGTSILCKATWLPYLVILPLLLVSLADRRIGWKHVSYIIVASLLVVFPWTLRNYNVTGKFIPVHLLTGFDLAIGDGVAENYSKSPLSSAALWTAGFDEKIRPLQGSLPKNAERWKREFLIDSTLVKRSLGKYAHSPQFLAKKVALNSLLFWTLGEDKKKTIVISLMQLPLLLVFVIAAINLLRIKGIRTIYGVHIFMVLAYYALHLPVFAVARFSIVLVPIVILYATCALADRI
jgi:4-amino-4-deoxy-L-arabinose transferase-like glycosyltransferase